MRAPDRRVRGWVAPGLCAAMIAAVALAHPLAAATRDFEVGTFDRIYFTGTGTLNLVQDRTAPTATVAHGSDAVLDALSIETSDGALYIDARLKDIELDDLTLDITLNDLRELVSDGRGRVTAGRIEASDLSIDGHGAGTFELGELEVGELKVTGRGATRFTLGGHVERQVIALDGVGRYRARGLTARSAELQVWGTSDVVLNVEEMLDVRVAGTARVTYLGSPTVTKDILGIGWVTGINVDEDPVR
jgi:hypothetical protein